MFEIVLNDETEQPMYQSLYIQIRNNIRNGVVGDGTKLPSIRSLQLQLNISKTPIETAYQMLISEGYVVSKPRSGFYVVYPFSDDPNVISARKERRKENSVVNSTKEKNAIQKKIIDFNPTAIGNDLFPIRIWNKAVKEAIERNQLELGKYGFPQGELKLRVLLCEYLYNSRGVNCTPEQIVIGNGITSSMNMISKLLDSKVFAIEEPGFNLVRNQLILNDCEVIPIPLDGTGIIIEELEKKTIEAVYVTPSHQFPTGCVMPYAKREQLIKWATANNSYIIEDDYDSEIRYVGKPIPSLQGMDNSGRVIYIGTFSKIFSPALRMNYMVIPQTLMERMKDISSEVNYLPSRFEQWAMSDFLEKGHLYRHIRRVRISYRKKHKLLVDLIRLHLEPHVEIKGENAGIHLQLVVKTKHSVKTLIEAAASNGVKVYDFKNMWMNEVMDVFPIIYLGFAAISEKDMEAGILLLKKSWMPLLAVNENCLFKK
ncbi:PLP-dependent aminotransferase family protein [Sporosarcina sp. ACRSL]|uniref:MocR-like pyridoxine biosynthesis transcription factor PdxR n=1 Tax=Sporosarcina sp. ACRSL TaxID=2918215 RepID=UPI001EF611E9|nr:PLP-dependent aminotransferase family protein [Sporosarcina sp. ACRSL]MCG7344721.1 PLP-dependent aminotransferase family protein [Sporosarcina sp. ACRSL]